MVFGRLSRLFGSGERRQGSGASGLGIEGIEKVGTPEDPLHGYEDALERNFAAMEAEQRGEIDRAISLYELSVSEEFVDSHPYERLANLYEQRRNYGGVSSGSGGVFAACPERDVAAWGAAFGGPEDEGYRGQGRALPGIVG